MECTICFVKMTGDNSIFSTLCGHIYHEHCLKDSMAKTEKKCPLCREPVSETTIHPLYLEIEQSGISEQIFMTRIADLTISIENLDKKLTDSLEKITMSMSAFEYQNEMLKTQNSELRQMMKGLENENKSVITHKKDSAAMQEQINAKDSMIHHLQKKLHDFRYQIVDTSREAFREKTNQLKATGATAKGESERTHLKDSTDQHHRLLTLEFDDFIDKLVIE